jgi:alkylhydroperoxidase family enzyme
MTRIHPAATATPRSADADPTARIQATLGGIWAHQPDAYRAYLDATSALRANGTLPARLVELVRLRIAFHNQCRTCMASRRLPDDVVSAALVCSLERPYEAADLTDAERVALRYADLFASDHLAIQDDTYDALRAYFTESELVELGMTCAYFVGFGRLAATWDIVEDLPDSFGIRGEGPITPWGHNQVLTIAPPAG